MQEYKVTERMIQINEGMVQLDEKQAKRRSYALSQVGDSDIYNIVRPIQFKNGETFGYQGQGLGKAALKLVEPVGVEDEAEVEETEETEKVEMSDTSVKDLKETLNLPTITKTLELLAEYDCKLKVGADLIPQAVLEKVAADNNLELVDEAEVEETEETE